MIQPLFRGFIKRLFGKPDTPPAPAIDKTIVPVYPKLRDAQWRGMPHVEQLPFAKQDKKALLNIVFPQDAGEHLREE